MKRLSTGLSRKSFTPQLTLTDRQLSFSNHAIFRVGSLKVGSLNDNMEGNKNVPNRLSIKISQNTLASVISRHKTQRPHTKQNVSVPKKLTVRKKYEMSMDSLHKGKKEISAILKESENIREQIFNSVPRDPKPSFKINKRHREYKKYWSPFTSFYERNNQ